MNSCDHETEVCPYDKSHMIVKSRMLTHLARCSKNFPDCEKKPCLYNNKHVIPVPELKYHLENCSDRLKIDLYKIKVGEVECPVKEEVPIAIELPPSEENWDEEPIVTGSVLDNIKDVTNKNILVTASYIGKSKRQRKDLRRQEILRHAQLNSTKKVDEKPVVDQSHIISSSTCDKKNPDTNPIRLPKELTSTSSKIQQIILKKKEGSMKSAPANSSVKEVPVSVSSSKDNTSKLAEDFKLDFKISSKMSDNCSVSSRQTEPVTSKSYASYVAQRLKEKAKNESIKGKSLNNIDVSDAGGKDCMQVLTSSIFEKGPRGRGRSITVSTPSSVSSQSSTPFSSDFNLLTDEHGFLQMPVPGKGRGKVIPQ